VALLLRLFSWWNFEALLVATMMVFGESSKNQPFLLMIALAKCNPISAYLSTARLDVELLRIEKASDLYATA
jgi:hypothetical protein